MSPHSWKRGRRRREDGGRLAECRTCGWAIEYYGEGFPSVEDLRTFSLSPDCDEALVESVMAS
jgi:hypothetical protein